MAARSLSIVTTILFGVFDATLIQLSLPGVNARRPIVGNLQWLQVPP